ncbi:MAG: SGNH/GDSL hydrolase family protein [Candidatus Omnitrophota bacterium]
MSKTSVKKRLNHLLFSIILVTFSFVIIECFSIGGLCVLGKWKKLKYIPIPDVLLNKKQNEVIRKLIAGEAGHAEYNSYLGWSPRAQAKTEQYQINSQSIRSVDEYSDTPSREKIRIAAFGDSFTFGQGVTNDETWEHHLSLLNPRYEILNFGVGGYGQDQAYLRYLDEGQTYRPDIVIIGFISENVFRNVNTFRPFYNPLTEFPLTKPRFKLDGEEIELIENPMKDLREYELLLNQPKKTIRQLGQHDYFYHQLYHRGPLDNLAFLRLLKVLIYNLSSKDRYESLFFKDDIFNKQSEGYQLAVKIIDQFYKKSEENGSIPLIVILPTKRDLSRLKAGVQKRYRPFIGYWEEMRYHVLDVNELVFREGIDVLQAQWYTEDGHNSGLMNQKIARHLHDYLKEVEILKGDYAQ